MRPVESRPETRADVVLAPSTSVSARIQDPALAGWLETQAPAFEVFRLLRAKVASLAEEQPLGCLGVIGAGPREGATSVALGLAAAFTQEPRRAVLVIEAALRAPAFEGLLGLPSQPGLGEWLESEGAEPVPLRRIEPWGFCVLPAGRSSPAASERLGSDVMGGLLAAARRAFDLVIVDCPALSGSADAVVLQDRLDGFLLVVRARRTSRDAVRLASGHLRPERLRGVVFNDRTDLLRPWLDRRRLSRPRRP